MGSPILQVLQTTNPRATPDALPHAPKPDSDPCPGYPQVVSYGHPASYRKSVGIDTVQKAVKTEISKKQYGLQKRNLGIWPLSFPIPHKAEPWRIMKNPHTPNLRAQVAGEVAMEAHPAPAPAGAEVRSQRTHHTLMASECRPPAPLS